MSDFAFANLDYIFFCYGLAYVLAAALCIPLQRERLLGVRWWQLGTFAALLGLVAWMNLAALSFSDTPLFLSVRIGLTIIAYALLFEFSREGVSVSGLPIGSRWLTAGLVVLALSGSLWGEEIAKITPRYALALPGGIAAALAMWRLSNRSPEGRSPLRWASVGFFAFAFFSGLISSPASFFPASILNQDVLSERLGLSAPLMRSLLALGIAIALIRYYSRTRPIGRLYGERQRVSFGHVHLIGILILTLCVGWFATHAVGRIRFEQHQAELLTNVMSAAAAVDPSDINALSQDGSSASDSQRMRIREDFRRQIESPTIFTSLILLQRGSGGWNVLVSADHGQRGSDISLADAIQTAGLGTVRRGEKSIPYTAAVNWTSVAPIAYAGALLRGVDQEYRSLWIIGAANARGWRQEIARQRLYPLGLTLVGCVALIAILIYRQRIRQTTVETVLSEKRYRALFEHSLAGNYVTSPDGTILLCNEAFAQTVGYESAAACLGNNARSLYPDEEDRRIFLARLTSERAVVQYEVELRRRDGELISVSETATGTFDDAGRLVQIQGNILDLSERRRIENALRESERRFREMADLLPEVIFETDENGFITFVNQQAFELYGYDARAGIPQLHVTDTIASEDRKRALDHFRNRLDQTYPHDNTAHDYLAVRADGTPFHVLIASSSIMRDGKFCGLRGIVMDITERKRAEQNLADWIRRYEMIVESSGQVVYDYDVFSGDITWGGSISGVFGYTTERFGSNIHEWEEKIHPDDKAEMVRLLDIAMEAGTPYDVRYRFRHDDGHYVWVHDRGFFIADGDGRSIRMLGMMTDVTALHEAEELLRRSLQTVSDVVNSIPAGLFIYQYHSPDKLLLVEANPSAERLTGIRIADCRGLEFEQLWPGVQGIGLKDAYLGVARTHKTFETHDLRYHDSRIDGAFHITAFAMPGERLGVAFEDITDKHLAETALRQSEARFREIVSKSSDAIIVLQNGRVVSANPRFEELFGVSSAELNDPGFDLREFSSPQGRPVLHEWAFVEDGERLAERESVKLVGTYGGTRDIEATLSAIIWDGQPARLAILRDVTEQRALQASFQQAQRMESIGRLAGGVAHDFNNLLTVINGHTELALMRLRPQDPLKPDLEEILKTAERATNLTRQLLAFSRKQIIAPQTINLNQTIADLNRMLHRIIGEKIELHLSAESDLWPVVADPGQIEQVMVNLVVNARDAMPKGGQIRILTENVVITEAEVRERPDLREGDFVRLTFSDTGVGMAEDVKNKAFEPFFTTKPVGVGTGLGLATVYGIIRQSGGCIELDSELGRGTTFFIYLPKSAGEIEAVSAQLPEPITSPRANSETILIVEDDTFVRETAVESLQLFGFKVLQADSAESALELCKSLRKPVDLVLTDMVMPGMDGQQLAGKLRELWPDVKVILMSGYTTDTVIVGPGTPFLQKPLRPAALVQKIREVLGN